MRQYVSFTGLHAGTGELSLGLHASRQLSDKVLRSRLLLSRPLPRAYTFVFHSREQAGRDFSRPPHVAMGVGLYLHRLAAAIGVKSLRVPTPLPGSAFPADCPHRAIVTAVAVHTDTRSSPHMADFG